MPITATLTVKGQQVKLTASADNPAAIMPQLVTLAVENPGEDIPVTLRVDKD